MRADLDTVSTTTTAPAPARSERAAPAPAPAGPHASVLRLQRAAGNAVVQRTLVQRSAAGAAPGITPEVEDAIHAARGGGQALDGGVRAQMEGAMGADFSGVRVHTDSRADALSQALGARAFTTGRDVFFRQGEYSPGSAGGRRLVAHELTHVVQQSGAPVQRSLTLGPADDAFEREADGVASAVADGLEAGVEHGDDGGTVRMSPASSAPLQAPASSPFLLNEPAGRQAAQPTAPVPARQGAPADRGAGAMPTRAEVEALQGRAVARLQAVTGFVRDARQQVAYLRGFYGRFDAVYQEAYGNYARVVRAARAEAQNQQNWANLLFGVAAGTAVGVLAEVLFPTLLAGATLARATVLGAGGNLASGSWGTWLGPQIAGVDLEPAEALSPFLQQLQTLRNLDELTGAVLSMVDPGMANLAAVMERSGGVLTELRAARRERSDADLAAEWARLRDADAAAAPVEAQVAEASAQFARLREHYKGLDVPSVRWVEQSIWIAWMSTLYPTGFFVLDLDEIEYHLADIGVVCQEPSYASPYGDMCNARLDVIFGSFTSGMEMGSAVRQASSALVGYQQYYGILFGYTRRG
ncbi:MAG: DUF4157 domain-containing protein [Gemmatimonadota bacterium]